MPDRITSSSNIGTPDEREPDLQALKEDPTTMTGKASLTIVQGILRATTRHDVLSILGKLADEFGVKVSLPEEKTSTSSVNDPKTSIIKPPQKSRRNDGRSTFDKFGRITVRELPEFARHDSLFVQSKTTEEGKILVIMSRFPILLEGFTLLKGRYPSNTGSQHIGKTRIVQLREILSPAQEELRAKMQKRKRNNTLNDTVGVHQIDDIVILTDEKEPKNHKGALWKRTVQFGTQQDYKEWITTLQEAINEHQKKQA